MKIEKKEITKGKFIILIKEFYNIKTNFLRNKNNSDKPKPTPPIPPPEDNNRPNNNDENNRPNDNNTPTPTTTSNTPTTTIPSTSTTSIPTTRTKTTTTFTFPDIPSHTTIDDTSTSTTTTTTTTIPSKTTTNTNTITTNLPTPTDNIDPSKTTIPPIPPKPTSENYISCPICKEELKENKIKKHLKEHIKNPLSKETICDKLKIKKQSISFTKMKEIINKITDVRVKEIIEEIQKLIETYGEQFIDYIPKEMKEQILYNFDKITMGVIGSIIRFSNLSVFFYKFYF